MIGKLFIVSAPSGAGKTTVVHALLQQVSSEYSLDRLITYTSKGPREGEQDGRDYHFITKQEFEQRIEQGFFLEWSNAYGAYYGTPRAVLQELGTGRSYVAIVDRIGAQQIVAQVNNIVLIWLYTADMTILRKRLAGRGTETDEQIAHRLTRAQEEIKLEQSNRLYTHHVVSDKITKTVDRLIQIVIDELCE